MTLEIESIVDADEADAEDRADSSCCVSSCSIVKSCRDRFVLSGLRAGFDTRESLVRCSVGLCAFRNVFLAVGDVADNVSNLKLVEPFPKTVGTLSVSSESFGRLAGDGRRSVGVSL